MKFLITKAIAESSAELLRKQGCQYDIVEVMRIVPIDVIMIPGSSDRWIISSRNALPTVEKFIGEAPHRLMVVGRWAADRLRRLLPGADIRSFANMKELSGVLAGEPFKTVLYFCGDQHRSELEHALASRPDSLRKVICYQSEMIFPLVKKEYDAVLVFSPRGAESLLSKNTFGSQTVFGCLGAATESWLHGSGIKNTFCASYPDHELLIKELLSRGSFVSDTTT